MLVCIPIASLEKDESENSNQSENDFSVNWSQLWQSAQKLYISVFDSDLTKLERNAYVNPLISLNIRKRHELIFLFLVSSLRHIMICRHSSGAPGNIISFSCL